MSRLFGQVCQLGYVVRDIEAAMHHWTSVMGVGPFFYLERAQFIDYRYRGTRYDLWVSGALAQCGSIQIELIQQRNEAPSMYRDFLAAGREGLQHIAFWHAPGRYEEVLVQALAQGFTVAMETATVEPEGKLVYFEQEAHPGTVVELSCLSPGKKKIFDMIADNARDWDGRDPIRRLDAR